MSEESKNLPANTVNTIHNLLTRPQMRKQLEMAIPRHMSVDRLLRVAMTAIRANPKLMGCTQESLLACIMGCAQLGLEPEPFLGQAYLVPFKRNVKVGNQWRSQVECQLIPGYRGYISLARRSGDVKSVAAQVVYENDHFRLQYGLDEVLEHVPAEGDRGAVRGAYCVFRYKDGSHSFDYMTKDDIDKIRARSKASDSGPWVTDYAEMAKKTVIRRHVKLAPLSVEMARAAAAENLAMAGESQVGLFDENATSIPYDIDNQEASVETPQTLTERVKAAKQEPPPQDEQPPEVIPDAQETSVPPLTAYEAEARRCDDAGDVTDKMQAALEAVGLANMPTKPADKKRVGSALLTLQAPDPA
jgi:recombination protein RecT